jgi:hypothetical protein
MTEEGSSSLCYARYPYVALGYRRGILSWNVRFPVKEGWHALNCRFAFDKRNDAIKLAHDTICERGIVLTDFDVKSIGTPVRFTQPDQFIKASDPSGGFARIPEEFRWPNFPRASQQATATAVESDVADIQAYAHLRRPNFKVITSYILQ